MEALRTRVDQLQWDLNRLQAAAEGGEPRRRTNRGIGGRTRRFEWRSGAPDGTYGCVRAADAGGRRRSDDDDSELK